jgi:hypothetical protein
MPTRVVAVVAAAVRGYFKEFNLEESGLVYRDDGALARRHAREQDEHDERRRDRTA